MRLAAALEERSTPALIAQVPERVASSPAVDESASLMADVQLAPPPPPAAATMGLSGSVLSTVTPVPATTDLTRFSYFTPSVWAASATSTVPSAPTASRDAADAERA